MKVIILFPHEKRQRIRNNTTLRLSKVLHSIVNNLIFVNEQNTFIKVKLLFSYTVLLEQKYSNISNLNTFNNICWMYCNLISC